MQRLQVIGTITFPGVVFLTAVTWKGRVHPGIQELPGGRRAPAVAAARVIRPSEHHTSPAEPTADESPTS